MHRSFALLRMTMLQYAIPFGAGDVDRMDVKAMALGVFDDGGWMIEAHRPIVEQGSGEGGEVSDFEKCAGVGDEGEAGGMGFGESVERERADELGDLILR